MFAATSDATSARANITVRICACCPVGLGRIIWTSTKAAGHRELALVGRWRANNTKAPLDALTNTCSVTGVISSAVVVVVAKGTLRLWLRHAANPKDASARKGARGLRGANNVLAPSILFGNPLE